jgi:superfamily II DNA or RNA helicase
MRLLFDHGTLVLAEAPDTGLERVPGLVWDARVALFRAPAFRYVEILRALEQRCGSLLDEVIEPFSSAGPRCRELELRPYQEAALFAWEDAGQRGIVVLPTGSGKTRVAIAALAGERGRALCLVPTRALLKQWLAELEANSAEPIGRIGDGEFRVEALTVATFESAFRHMPALGRRFDCLIVDEAHHFGSGVRDEALEMCVAPRRLGLTATPPANGALSRLAELVGPVVYQLAVSDLSGSYLAEFEIVVLRLGLDPDERDRYTEDERAFLPVYRAFRRLHPDASWRETSFMLSQSAEGRAALAAKRRCRKLLQFTRAKARAVRRLLARHRGSRVIVFTADNEAAYALARQHLIMPITCDVNRSEREEVLDAFRRGELTALVSARVLNEGIDVPDADVAIIVGGTQGEREHVQRIGRLLRPAPGKRAIVYELVTMATSEAWLAANRRRGIVATYPLPA